MRVVAITTDYFNLLTGTIYIHVQSINEHKRVQQQTDDRD